MLGYTENIVGTMRSFLNALESAERERFKTEIELYEFLELIEDLGLGDTLYSNLSFTKAVTVFARKSLLKIKIYVNHDYALLRIELVDDENNILVSYSTDIIDPIISLVRSISDYLN